MGKAVKQFSKEERCSKIDIWNCFFGEGSRENGDTRSSDITRAKSIIGRNVPRVLLQAGHCEMEIREGQQHIKLTAEGQNWLTHGTLRYLKNQPDKFVWVENPPRRWRKRFMKTVAE